MICVTCKAELQPGETCWRCRRGGPHFEPRRQRTVEKTPEPIAEPMPPTKRRRVEIITEPLPSEEA